MAGQMYPPVGMPTSRVELFIKGIKLLDLDVMSKSDPQVHVLAKDKRGQWMEIGRTEEVKDSLNPVFSKSIQMDYRFEEVQPLRFVCVDVDKPGAPMDKQELIGSFECTLGDIVGSKGSRLMRRLFNPKYQNRNAGHLIITCEEVNDVKQIATIEFSARNLDKKDFFGKSDPFLRISRMRGEREEWDAVHKTEVIKNNLNPNWKRFKMSMQALCNGDERRPLLIQCYDWNSSGKEDMIGECKTSVHELRQLAASKRGIDLRNPSKAHKKSYTNSGVLQINLFEVHTQPTFLDYIRGGMEVNLVLAVDFTASNGNPADPNSLHYMGDPSRPTQYARAIQQVGAVLMPYDTDQQIPAFGFGARLPPTGVVSHCFPLNFNVNNPEIQGLDNILGAYAHALRTVQLYGPTNFSQLIETTARMAAEGAKGSKYIILLILTDGAISDMDATIDQIVAASTLPLSIVIVGVGNADFTNMDRLDADTAPLVDRRGRRMARDIVQFVPMRDYINAHPGRIAEVTLEEIPQQVLGFMESNNIKPRPLVRADTVAMLQSSPSVAQYPPAAGAPQPGASPYPQTSPTMQYPGSPGSAPQQQPYPYPAYGGAPQQPGGSPGPSPVPPYPSGPSPSASATNIPPYGAPQYPPAQPQPGAGAAPYPYPPAAGGAPSYPPGSGPSLGHVPSYGVQPQQPYPPQGAPGGYPPYPGAQQYPPAPAGQAPYGSAAGYSPYPPQQQ